MAIIKVSDTDNFDLWKQKTNLLSLMQGDLERLLVNMAFPITGTVTSVGVDLTGSGTLFTTELAIGTVVENITNGERRKIVEITSDTTAKTDTPFTPVLAANQLATVDYVTALNTAFLFGDDAHRRTLIRAIAMS